MDRMVSVRESVHIGCAGDEPTTPLWRGGESPSFVLSLTNEQITAVASFVEEHGFWSHLADHSVEHHALWSLNLTTIEELTLSCSCGVSCTFDPAGEEVKHGQEVL